MTLSSPPISDAELLARYVRDRSDATFAQIVSRHVDLVHGAAVRQVRDRHVAEDVVQAVFIVLTRRAGSVRAERLATWLLTTTRYCALDAIRKDRRRQRYEKEAAMSTPDSVPPPDTASEELLAYLDEALCRLRKRDSQALTLRYLQNQPMRKVAQELGVSVDAAQKIVSRALAKLRGILGRRGVVLSGAVVVATMVQESAKAAPPGLAISSAGASAAASASQISIAKGAIQMMFWTHAKAAIAAVAAAAIAAGTGEWVVRHALADDAAPAPMVAQVQAPLSPPLAPPAAAEANAAPGAYDSPFLELVGCRMRVPLELQLSQDNAPPISVACLGQQYPEALWQPSPVWTSHVAGYSLSISSQNSSVAPVNLQLPPSSRRLALAQDLDSPDDYSITLLANDAAGKVIASASADVTIQPPEPVQVAISDIQRDGTMRFWTVLQEVNDGPDPIATYSFKNSDIVRLEKIYDDKNRPISFTTVHQGSYYVYTCTLNEPIQPGDVTRALSVGTIAGLIQIRPDGSYAYSFNQCPGGQVAVRRFDLIRLPPAAILLSLNQANLASKVYEGQIQIYSDAVIPAGSSHLVAFRYRLPRP
jgi:RNA polymerase sigma factor (sigma-70 family)